MSPVQYCTHTSQLAA
ncbi:hypothetical protein COD92_23225 [Bacillus sp. AFS037270]|nr:hypothetical protein COD92_23225 [Bacillus sp. AFS037270]